MTPIFIAGPCVIESADLLDEVACELGVTSEVCGGCGCEG